MGANPDLSAVLFQAAVQRNSADVAQFLFENGVAMTVEGMVFSVNSWHEFLASLNWALYLTRNLY